MHSFSFWQYFPQILQKMLVLNILYNYKLNHVVNVWIFSVELK